MYSVKCNKRKQDSKNELSVYLRTINTIIMQDVRKTVDGFLQFTEFPSEARHQMIKFYVDGNIDQ